MRVVVDTSESQLLSVHTRGKGFTLWRDNPEPTFGVSRYGKQHTSLHTAVRDTKR